jgi:hypothetical protein
MSWLQKHSTVWAHFHPTPVIEHVCSGCGGKAPTLCDEHPHHAIGRVNYSDGGEHILFCDGSESKS